MIDPEGTSPTFERIAEVAVTAIMKIASGSVAATRVATSRNSPCCLIAVNRPTVVTTWQAVDVQSGARFRTRAVVDGHKGRDRIPAAPARTDPPGRYGIHRGAGRECPAGIGDDPIGDGGQAALDAQEEPRLSRAEISVEDVAVIGVQHARASVATGGPVVNRRRDPANGAGLGHVGVDNPRPEIAHHVEQLRQRDGIVRGGERSPQRGQVFRGHERGQQITHVPFAALQPSVHQQRLEATRRQPIQRVIA